MKLILITLILSTSVSARDWEQIRVNSMSEYINSEEYACEVAYFRADNFFGWVWYDDGNVFTYTQTQEGGDLLYQQLQQYGDRRIVAEFDGDVVIPNRDSQSYFDDLDRLENLVRTSVERSRSENLHCSTELLLSELSSSSRIGEAPYPLFDEEVVNDRRGDDSYIFEQEHEDEDPISINV